MAIVQVNLSSATIGLLFDDMISRKRIYRSRTNGEGSQGQLANLCLAEDVHCNSVECSDVPICIGWHKKLSHWPSVFAPHYTVSTGAFFDVGRSSCQW